MLPYIIAAFGFAFEGFADVFEKGKAYFKVIGFTLACYGLWLAYNQKLNDDRIHALEVNSLSSKSDSLGTSLTSAKDSLIQSQKIQIGLLLEMRQLQIAARLDIDSAKNLSIATKTAVDSAGFNSSNERPVIQSVSNVPNPVIRKDYNEYVIRYKITNESNIPACNMRCIQGYVIYHDLIGSKILLGNDWNFPNPLSSKHVRSIELVITDTSFNSVLTQGVEIYYFCHTTYSDKFGLEEYSFSHVARLEEFKLNGGFGGVRNFQAKRVEQFLNKELFHGKFKM